VGDKEKVVAHMTDEDKSLKIVAESIAAQQNPDTEHLSQYLCEVCELTADLTEEEAYKGGWDYPPFIGAWGVISPRTCPNCRMEDTAYWHIVMQGTENLSEKHIATVKRILAERERPDAPAL
jgi:hypothetical protein